MGETYKTHCVLISRKPKVKAQDTYKTLVIALFDVNNAHKTGQPPTQVLEFPNIEKMRVYDATFSFYLEGNDIIINNLKSVTIDIQKEKAVLHVVQEKAS